MRVDTVSLQQFHQFNQLIRSCISTRRELIVRSYFQLQCHC